MFVTSIHDLLPVSPQPDRGRDPRVETEPRGPTAGATDREVETTSEPVARPVEGDSADPREETVSRIREQFEEIQSRGYLRELRLEHKVTDDGRIVVKIHDARTDKVIRELPPEEQLEFARRLQDSFGALFDQQA